jgi:hypothetical protein
MDILSRLNAAAGSALRDERLQPASWWRTAKTLARAAAKRADRLAWRVKLIAVLGLAFLVLFLAGPVGIASHFSERLRAESLERGMALVEMLAATNAQAFKDQQDVLFSTASVSAQAGVQGAYVSDADGMIVAPVELYGKRVDAIAGMNASLHERAGEGLRVYRMKGGDYVLTYPVVNYVEQAGGFDRLVNGVAYLRYDADAYGWWYAPAEVLKFVVIAILVGWGCYVLLRRWTLWPLKQLAEQGAGDAGNSLQATGIRFDEVDRLCEARVGAEPHARGTTAGVHTDGASMWHQLESLGIGDYLVLDAHKRIVSVSGVLEKTLKCSFERGTHLLDHSGAAMDALMKLVVAMDAAPGAAVETEVDRSMVLVGAYIENGDGAYVVTFRRKKRR